MEFCRLVGKPADAAVGLAQVEQELHTALGELEQTLAEGDGPVRLDDDGDLVISPLLLDGCADEVAKLGRGPGAWGMIGTIPQLLRKHSADRS